MSNRTKEIRNHEFWRSTSRMNELPPEDRGILFSLLAAEANIGKALVGDDRYFSCTCHVSKRKWRSTSSRLEAADYIGFCEATNGYQELFFKFESPFLIVKLVKMFERQAIPHALRMAVYERDGFACTECGRPTHLSCDHRIAVTSGGKNTFENLITLCIPCNISKGARSK